METPATDDQRGEKKGICLSGAVVRPPPSVESSRRSHWNKEALLPETRREEVEVRKVLKKLRSEVRLEGPFQDLWYKRVQM